MASVISNYEITEKLFESVGTLVYRGTRIEDRLPVVLKILKLEAASVERQERFKREFELLSRLDLPGVIKAYALEQHHGSLIMALEDVNGNPVDRIIFGIPRDLGPFLQIAIKTADTLGNLHQKRIIHKNINPAHIIANQETGQVRLISFGLADDLPQRSVGIQPPAALEGSLAYLSPEQTGRMNRAVDFRADFYSLGATFYRMLAGRQPFEAPDAMGMVHCHIARTPATLHELNPAVPEAVSAVIKRLMAKMAEDRYQSCRGLKADLERCLEEFCARGRIELFELGTGDVSEEFRIPQRLYGRERDLGELIAAFERAAEGGRELVLIRGGVGVGKTALARELFKTVAEKSGYFVEGKFDEFEHGVPFFGWIQAFTQLMQYLLMENEAALGTWKSRILGALGRNAKLFADVIPDLERIIGPQPDVPESPPEEARVRFHKVFRDFVKVFAEEEHPFVVLLDDLQWADEASLFLIESLMDDPGCRHFLFVGSCRDETTDALVQRLVSRKHSARCRRTGLELLPLLPEHTGQMITEILKLPEDQARDLTGLVHARTDGNPFFIKEFLLKLHEERLIRFDGTWKFDREGIARSDIPDNIVHLVAGRIDRLNDDAQKVLRVAACIGSNVTVPLVAELSGMHAGAVAAALNAAAREGFVLNLNHHYGFVHDRVRETVYSRIDGRTRAAMHHAIGRAMLASARKASVDEPIFEVVRHLNMAAYAIGGPEERRELMLLNLRAGLKAKLTTAYESAAGYFRRAVSLLPVDNDGESRKYGAIINTELAEAAYLTGGFDEAWACIDEALKNAPTLLDQVKACEIAMRIHISLNNMQEALRTGRQAVRLLVPEMPRKAAVFTVRAGISLARSRFGRLDADDLLQLPDATDPYHIALARMLMNCMEPAYISQPDYYPVLIKRLLRHSMLYGNTKYSSYAYLMYGVMLCCGLGDIEKGHRFGLLALDLMNRFRADDLKCRNYFFFGVAVNHWKKHLRDDLEYLWSSYLSGQESGDAAFSSYALNHYHFHLFFMGEPLEKVRDGFQKHHEAARRVMQVPSLQAYELWYQLVCTLMGESEDATRIRGAICDEDEIMAGWKRLSNFTTLGFHTVARQLLLYLTNRYAEAVFAAESGAASMNGVQGMIFVPEHHFYHALSLLAVAADAREEERKSAIRKVKEIEKLFADWSRHAPMNYRHKYELIRAELKGQDRRVGIEDVLKLYDLAASSAREQGYLLDEALANERAARFLMARDLHTLSAGHLQTAYDRYVVWGAKVKTARLEAEFPVLLLSRAGGLIGEDERAPRSSTELDLHTVMKAGQAVSSELKLDRLIERLMSIVVESAGAQTGYLLFEKDGTWTIAAHCDVDRGTGVEVASPVAVDENDAIAAGVVRYVAHRKEKLLLDNAAVDGAFAQDASLRRRAVKSLLCMPVMSRGRMIAVLYLENNAVSRAFTSDRLRLLELILAQAAPSLENARVHEALRESEEKFRAVAETTTASIFVYRENILYMNPAAEALSGYSRDELLGMELSELVHPDFREAAKARVLARLRGENIGVRFEYKIKKKDGSEGWIDFAATAFQFEGKPAGLGVAFDVTERKNAETERARLENQLRQAQKMEAVGTLAGGVAHDFNNILTAIMGYGSMVRSRMAADNPLRGYVDDILTSAHRAASLTRSLLAFSRKQELSPKIEDLNEIVQGVEKLLLRVIGEDIDFKTLLSDEPLMTMADASQMEQVLMNLAANARDAMPEGGILTIKTERRIINGPSSMTVLPKGAYAVISVSDTGSGMDEETRKRIFEPFFTTKEPGKGTGLGLSMVYGIVKQHNGEISAYSEPHKGTTFKIYLKLATAAAERVHVLPQAPPEGGTETILIAEDDSAVRKFLRHILEDFGYTVIESVDGEDAAAKFMEHKERIQLLILDVVMPRKNGKDAYEAICRVKSGVPVIFSSGYTADIISQKGALEEGHDFISKPIDSDQLLAKIREILSRK